MLTVRTNTNRQELHNYNHFCDMITVPQVWQLPQITHCCPGIGPLGVKGMEVVHVYEGVGKGKNDVPVCVGWKGVEVTGSTELLGGKWG